MSLKKIIIVALIISAACSETREMDFPDYPISIVDIKSVELTDNFWLPKIKLVQNTTIDYAFKKCEEEGRMNNFLVAGGRKEGTVQGKMPFDDTDVYKIIEGASYSLVSQPNPELDNYLDSLIKIISIGQEPDGYLTTWSTIDRKHPPAKWVKSSNERWGSLDASHELYNSGHLFEAAAAHYWVTGKRNFLNIALKNADLLVRTFGPDKIQFPPGHQIVETGLIKLYHITQNKNYLELSKFFLETRGDSANHKLYGEYSQDHIPVLQQNQVVGHSVRALYMYSGMTDIAAIYKDMSYRKAVEQLWKNAVYKKTYITGGLGSRNSSEGFGEEYDLPNLVAYNETCAAIGSIYWNHRLFLLTGDSKYYDIIERTLYNGMISGISLDGKKFFYPNPTESDGEYKFNHGSCTRESWFDCSCCPTNLIRFIPSIPGLVYAKDQDILYINMYIANEANINLANINVKVTQISDYPWNGNIKINVAPDEKIKFTLKLRVPGWAVNSPIPGNLYKYLNVHSEKINISLNGEVLQYNINDGYIIIDKEWEKGDQIVLNIPMKIMKVVADEKVIENLNKIAIEYGPIVYCAENIDNKNISEIQIGNEDRFILKRSNMLDEQFIQIEGENVVLVPYYLWSNRGVTKMKVWFPKAVEH